MVRKPFGGVTIEPDEAFAAVVGRKPLTPAQMTKKVWEHIKKNKLMSR